MGFGGLLLGGAALMAVNQVGQGYVQKAESEYNAGVMESQAGMTDVQKEIDYAQYQRLKGKTLSQSAVSVAGMGVEFKGSVVAAMIDAQKQINIDQALGQFEYNKEKLYALSSADAYRRQGSRAVYGGYSNAFSTMLSAAGNFAYYQGMINKPTTKINT